MLKLALCARNIYNYSPEILFQRDCEVNKSAREERKGAREMAIGGKRERGNTATKV